jgi:hypothetical protein
MFASSSAEARHFFLFGSARRVFSAYAESAFFMMSCKRVATELLV